MAGPVPFIRNASASPFGLLRFHGRAELQLTVGITCLAIGIPIHAACTATTSPQVHGLQHHTHAVALHPQPAAATGDVFDGGLQRIGLCTVPTPIKPRTADHPLQVHLERPGPERNTKARMPTVESDE